MALSIYKQDIFSKMAAIIIAVTCYFSYFSLHNAQVVYILSLVCCGLLLVKSIRYKFLFIFYFFITTYLLFLYPHFMGILTFNSYSFNDSTFFDKALYLFSLFLTSMLFFYKSVPMTPINVRVEIKDNPFVFYLNIAVQAGIILFGAQGQSVLSSTYGSNELVITTVNNYYPIFFLASYFSSGNAKGKLLLLNTIAIIYCVNLLMLGGRGATISMALTYYLIVMDRRISFMTLLIGIFGVFIFMMFWGMVRGGQLTSFFTQGIGGFVDMLGLGVSKGDKYMMQGGHQADVYSASVRIISMTDIGVIDFGDRLYALYLFVISIFVPYSILPPIANLSTYMIADYNTLGGGMIFAYFYTFVSYFGVVLAAFTINLVWNKLRSSTNKYILVYCILVFATMNGWFAYNPITLFKLCLWGLIYVYAMDILTRMLVKK